MVLEYTKEFMYILLSICCALLIITAAFLPLGLAVYLCNGLGCHISIGWISTIFCYYIYWIVGRQLNYIKLNKEFV